MRRRQVGEARLALLELSLQGLFLIVESFLFLQFSHAPFGFKLRILLFPLPVHSFRTLLRGLAGQFVLGVFILGDAIRLECQLLVFGFKCFYLLSYLAVLRHDCVAI